MEPNKQAEANDTTEHSHTTPEEEETTADIVEDFSASEHHQETDQTEQSTAPQQEQTSDKRPETSSSTNSWARWLQKNGVMRPFHESELIDHDRFNASRNKRTLKRRRPQTPLRIEISSMEPAEPPSRRGSVTGFSWEDEWEVSEQEIAIANPPENTDASRRDDRELLEQQLREELSDELYAKLKAAREAEALRFERSEQQRWLVYRQSIEGWKDQYYNDLASWNEEAEKFRNNQRRLQLDESRAVECAEIHEAASERAYAKVAQLELQLADMKRAPSARDQRRDEVRQRLEDTATQLKQTEADRDGLVQENDEMQVMLESVSGALGEENKTLQANLEDSQAEHLQQRTQLEARNEVLAEKNEELRRALVNKEKASQHELKNNSALKLELDKLKKIIKDDEVAKGVRALNDKCRKLEIEKNNLEKQTTQSLQEEKANIQTLETANEKLQKELSSLKEEREKASKLDTTDNRELSSPKATSSKAKSPFANPDIQKVAAEDFRVRQWCRHLSNQLNLAFADIYQADGLSIARYEELEKAFKALKSYLNHSEKVLQMVRTYFEKIDVSSVTARCTNAQREQGVKSKKMESTSDLETQSWRYEIEMERAKRLRTIKYFEDFRSTM